MNLFLFRNSKLTEMLKEELGGNFKTRVIMCFRPETDSYVVAPMLRLASQFNKVNNFPVLNDSFAQVFAFFQYIFVSNKYMETLHEGNQSHVTKNKELKFSP